MVRTLTLLGIAFAVALAACSGGDSKSADPDAGPSADQREPADLPSPPDGAIDLETEDAAVPGETVAGDTQAVDVPGELPPDECGWYVPYEAPPTHGVAYVVHFLDHDLRWARVDGVAPADGGILDLGDYGHDMALDPKANLLAVAQDVAHRVLVLQVTPPENEAAPVEAPSLVGEIDFGEDLPVFVTMDPARTRLFVVVAPKPTGDVQDEFLLHAYDLSNPAAPALLGGGPVTVPATTTVGVDPLAGILFLVGMTEDRLHLYDIAGETPTLLPGTPVDLRELYPQENNTGFQARNIQVDPWKGRLYMARAQGALSEVMILSYLPAYPAPAVGCPARPGYDSFTVNPDFFDVDVPVEDRPNLLDAFVALPDVFTGGLFLLADAWNGTGPSAIAISMDPLLDVVASCGAFEGFGCWVQSWFGGNAGSHLRTDGAACLDTTHKVLVASSIDAYNEEDPGYLHFFRYDANLALEPWLTAEGGNVKAGALPVALACH
jgi:hypothetical protein